MATLFEASTPGRAMRIAFLVIASLLLLAETCAAEEILGKVADANEDTVRITTDSSVLPRDGDVVEIYFQVPGLDESVQIGFGKVTGVTVEFITARIDKAKTKLTRNQLARVTSASPRPRAEVAAETAPSTPKVPSVTGMRTPGGLPGSTGVSTRTFTGLSYVVALAFAADGQQAIACGGGIRRWDIASGTLVGEFSFPEPAPIVAAISSDGKQVLTGDNQCLVKLWDTETGQEIRRFTGHTTWINAVAFSRDGRFVASGAGQRELQEVPQPGAAADAVPPTKEVPIDCTIRIWDVATGRELRRFEKHHADVTSVTFSPNGLYVLSTSADGTMRLWDIQTGMEVQRFAEPAVLKIKDAFFSPDALTVVSLSSGGQELGGVVAPFPANHIIPNPQFGVSAEPMGDTTGCAAIRLWNQAGGAMRTRVMEGCIEVALCAAMSPDGRRLVVGVADTEKADGVLRVFELPDGVEPKSITLGDRRAQRVVVSPDSRHVLISDREGGVRFSALPQ